MGVAAYPFFAPFMPEFFTSPGPSTIYFNRNNKRLQKAAGPPEAGHGGDGRRQHDVLLRGRAGGRRHLPNFFGTSAAAPHAAAIGALVLRRRAGRAREAEPDAQDPPEERVPARSRPAILVGERADGSGPAVDRRVGRPERHQRRSIRISSRCGMAARSAVQHFAINLNASRIRPGRRKGIVFDKRRGPRHAVHRRHGRSDSILRT